MSLDEIVKQIMRHKCFIGEFSLDLYYDDCNRSGCNYVARLSLKGGNEVHHCRRESFIDAAIEAMEMVVFRSGMAHQRECAELTESEGSGE